MKRIRELRKKRNITMKDLGYAIGVAESTISLYENGKRQPDNETMSKIADYFGVSIDYLLGRSQSPSEKKGIIKAPVLGYVAAGVPIEQIEDILDYEELDPESFNPTYEYFGLKIKGDSMQPRIADGDVVIVRKQPNVESGEIAIVCVNGDEATCKQVKKHSDGLSLISFNPAFEPMYFTAKEVEKMPITILGKVVELRGKF